jgi:GAF domain-containing protein
MATHVLRRDSQVAVAGPEAKQLSALDQERLAAHAIYEVGSVMGTPVRMQPSHPRSPSELVGAIVAVNKYRALGKPVENQSELAHDKDGFSEVDKMLFEGIAEQLGMALKLATRQAIIKTAQEDHVESIVASTSVIAGVWHALLLLLLQGVLLHLNVCAHL